LVVGVGVMDSMVMNCFILPRARLLGKGRSVKGESLKALVDDFGERYSEILGIDLAGGEDGELFRWFLAAVPFGAPMREEAAIRTYRCFEKHKALTPERILQTGWKELIKTLDEGGYTRYDFKTADKLLEVMRNMLKNMGEA